MFNACTQTFLYAPFPQRVAPKNQTPAPPLVDAQSYTSPTKQCLPGFPPRVYETGESSSMAANRTAILISREHMELWMKAINDRIRGAHEP